MKMKRALLIQAIDDALKAHEGDKDRYAREVAEWQKDRRERWFDDDLPRWRALRDTITERIRHGEVLTSKEVQKIMGTDWIGYLGWTPEMEPRPNQVKRVRTVDTVGLTALRRTLESIADDEVSDAQLARLGFRKLYDVFRAAAGV